MKHLLSLKNLVSLFKSKFFCANSKFSLAKLGHICQRPREDLDTYMKRFHDRALDCYDPVEEKMLVDVLSPRYDRGIPHFLREIVFLLLFQVNGSYLSHQRVNIFASRSSTNSSSWKRSLIATLEKGERVRSSKPRKPTQDRRGPW